MIPSLFQVGRKRSLRSPPNRLIRLLPWACPSQGSRCPMSSPFKSHLFHKYTWSRCSVMSVLWGGKTKADAAGSPKSPALEVSTRDSGHTQPPVPEQLGTRPWPPAGMCWNSRRWQTGPCSRWLQTGPCRCQSSSKEPRIPRTNGSHDMAEAEDSRQTSAGTSRGAGPMLGPQASREAPGAMVLGDWRALPRGMPSVLNARGPFPDRPSRHACDSLPAGRRSDLCCGWTCRPRFTVGE